MGYLEIAKGEEKKAIVYFKKTIKKDKEGEFGKQALREINRISQK
jgi:2-oxo-4-hydroxy-4-carboxy--5-ureidoimidazoline (OHCU) decarboxylase